MSTRWRWDPCVNHRGRDAACFVADYFANETRRPLVIAGAGFDPRSPVICARVARVAGLRTRALFIREERPNPDPELAVRAEHNLAQMREAVPAHDVANIAIFASDGAVVGGRMVVGYVNGVDFTGVTDVVVDCSAFSIGISFPLVRHLLARTQAGTNLHLMVTHEPATDSAIVATAGDTYGTIHGFRGDLGLSSSNNKAKL